MYEARGLVMQSLFCVDCKVNTQKPVIKYFMLVSLLSTFKCLSLINVLLSTFHGLKPVVKFNLRSIANYLGSNGNQELKCHFKMGTIHPTFVERQPIAIVFTKNYFCIKSQLKSKTLTSDRPCLVTLYVTKDFNWF